MPFPKVAVRLLPIFLPIAAAWVRAREKKALAEGLPLSECEVADAVALGVRYPERVRLFRVERISTFEHPFLRPVAWIADRYFASTAGLALNYAILVRSDSWRQQSLVAHELVHVAQYERFGGIGPFLRAYLRECLVMGYPWGPLEQEAIVESARLRGA